MGLFSGIFANIKGVFKQSERDIRAVLKEQEKVVKASTLAAVQQSLTSAGGPSSWGVIDKHGQLHGHSQSLAEAYVLARHLNTQNPSTGTGPFASVFRTVSITSL